MVSPLDGWPGRRKRRAGEKAVEKVPKDVRNVFVSIGKAKRITRF